MAKSKFTGKKAPKAKRAAAMPKGPIWWSPGRGLMVSMIAQTPKSADEKIVTAKLIVQAVQAAITDSVEGNNHDIHWPLHEAIYLLERASEQLAVTHG